MWEFLTMVLQTHGLVALVQVIELGFLVYLFRALEQKDRQKAQAIEQKEKEKEQAMEKLLALSEKRLHDAKEERDDYEALSRELKGSIDLLVQVFRSRNGTNGNGTNGNFDRK